MSIQEILDESAFIQMSLSNLDICNESMGGLVTKGIDAVKRMIEKFITWIKETVIPFLRKIGKAIMNIFKKNKVPKNAENSNVKEYAKDVSGKTADVVTKKLNGNSTNVKGLPEVKRSLLKYPTWLNFIANSLINPNAIMKFANSTEDRSDDIQTLEERLNKYINDGGESKILTDAVAAKKEAKEQLGLLQKAIATFESNAAEILKRCEELKRSLNGKIDNGSKMRAANISLVLTLITKKTAEAIKLSSENVLMLQNVIIY